MEYRVEDMARDGIDATVMYGPIVPILIRDGELRRVCYRAYNEWLAEFCATAPERLVGAGLIPIDEPKVAADEVRHLHGLGIRTGMLLAARVEVPLWDEAWEPLWEAAAEAGMPIGFQLGGGLRTVVERGPRFNDPGNMGVRVACATLQMDEPLAAVIFSGALDATPGSRSCWPRPGSDGCRTCSRGWTTRTAGSSTPPSSGGRTAGSG